MKRLMLTGFLFLAMALIAFVPKAQAIGTLAGTPITNQAYSDYKDANGNPLQRVYSNTVTTVVSQVYAVRTEPPTNTKQGAVDTWVYYPATIHNDGNGYDTFTLTATNTDPYWETTVIYRDDNKNGILDPGETTVLTATSLLPADGIEYVIVATLVPTSGVVNYDDISTVTLTATSQNYPAATDSSLFQTTVLQAVVSITKAASTYSPIPGEEITYTITITNAGNTSAYYASFIDKIPAFTTYVPGSMRVGPLGGTYATATVLTDANDVEPNVAPPQTAYYNATTTPKQLEFFAGTIPAQTSFVGYFKVTVNANVPAGSPIGNTATATYRSTSDGIFYTSSSNQTVSTVDQDPAVSVTPYYTTATGDPSDQVVFPLEVCNLGNDTDVLDITYTSTAGWIWTFWLDANEDNIPGNDGDTLLVDTDGDGKIDIDEQPQGDCARILAVTIIPAGTPDAYTDTLVVKATSSIDPNVYATSGNLVTTVTAPILTVTKSVSPTGPQPPGTMLTYTVTVTNIGTGTATNVFVTDVRPDFTTYVTGSIRAGAPGFLAVKTDSGVDNDGAQYEAGSHTVIASNPSLGAGGIFVVEFKVTIN